MKHPGNKHHAHAQAFLRRSGYAEGGDVVLREPEPVMLRSVDDVKPAKLQDQDVKVRQLDDVKPRVLAPVDDDVKLRALQPERRGGRLDRPGKRRK